jgi:hypothetical protein
VLAPLAERELAEFDARYELTALPTKWLYGPAPFADAAAWLETHADLEDEVDMLDRLFAVRIYGGQVFLPMRPQIFKAVPESSRTGRWSLIQADYPNDAHAHARHQARGEKCPDGKYGGCPVTEIAEGAWDEMVKIADRMLPELAPDEFVSAAVPHRYPFPEDVGYDLE